LSLIHFIKNKILKNQFFFKTNIIFLFLLIIRPSRVEAALQGVPVYRGRELVAGPRRAAPGWPARLPPSFTAQALPLPSYLPPSLPL
jgi:hypothetical protein